MTVSSRTPEGLPFACPICGRAAALEPSCFAGDSVCPSCGSLLWLVRDRVLKTVDPSVIHLGASLSELGVDSLDLVELVLELEGELGVTISDEEAERLHTVADVLRLLHRLRERRDE